MNNRQAPDMFDSIYLEGVWVKASPAFNTEICERFRKKPILFQLAIKMASIL